MRCLLPIILLLIFLSCGLTQVVNHVYIQDSNWMDGIGSIDIIAFDPDEIYREYHWVPSYQALNLVNYGSYNVNKDTIACQTLLKNAESFEYIILKVDNKFRLLRNEKVYYPDGTLSELRLHTGRYGQELTKEQYKEFKAIRTKN